MSPLKMGDAPRQLPNVLLYLGALLRRRQITPDLRAKNIAYVDWPGLRGRGYNAVVIDKDNCLTWPDRDSLYPPLSAGWNQLKQTFGPGKVLVVSNSSGTTKDHGGLSAESVSRHLGVPVLLHQQRKPGCAADILAYFSGSLKAVASSHTPLPPTLDLQGLEDVDMLVPSTKITQRKIAKTLNEAAETSKETVAPVHDEPLNILVVGDRQFTDTLLAHRLSLHFPQVEAGAIPRALSIHTTMLPKPADVRALRWLENFLAPGIKRSSVDWGRYLLAQEIGVEPAQTEVAAPSLSRFAKVRRTASQLTFAVRWLASAFHRLVANFRSKSELAPNSIPLDGGRATRILRWIRSRLPGSRLVTRE